MNNIELLGLPPEKQTQLTKRLEALNRGSGISIEFLGENEKGVFVLKARQKTNHTALNKFEIQARVKDALKPFISDKKHRIIAHRALPNYSVVSKNWVAGVCQRHGLSLKDLAIDIGIDYNKLNEVLSNVTKPSLTVKLIYWRCMALKSVEELQNYIEAQKLGVYCETG